jgi:hypothetical protein
MQVYAHPYNGLHVTLFPASPYALYRAILLRCSKQRGIRQILRRDEQVCSLLLGLVPTNVLRVYPRGLLRLASFSIESAITSGIQLRQWL